MATRMRLSPWFLGLLTLILSGWAGVAHAGWQRTYKYASGPDPQFPDYLWEAPNARMAIGDGRGDGRMRLYSTSAAEWEWRGEQLIYQFLINGVDVGGGDDLVVWPGGGGLERGLVYLATSHWRFVGGGWQYTSLGTTPDYQSLAVGPGRNDGVTRIYTGGGGVWGELSPAGSGWSLEVRGTYPGGGRAAMGLWPAAGTGKLRLHVVGADSIEQFEWTGSTWTSTTIGANLPYGIDSAAFGDARNDGQARIYVGTSEDRIGGKGWIREWTETSSGWRNEEVAGRLPRGIPGTRLVLADGRGDGVKRLYAIAEDKIVEFTWQAGQWRSEALGTIERPVLRDRQTKVIGIWDYLTDLAVGEVRGDGKPRVYGLSAGGRLYEWTYVGAPGQQGSLLQPPYPNPYRPASDGKAWVPVVVSSAGAVTVTVWSASGELVRTVVDEERPAGYYWERWDGRNEAGQAVASGWYLIGVVVAGTRGVTKLMVIR